MKTFTVEVTQADIDEGSPCQMCRCPVAIAIKRRLDIPGATVVRKSWKVAGTTRWFKHTKKVAAFIRNVDSKKRVRPSRFRFIVPDDFPLPDGTPSTPIESEATR